MGIKMKNKTYELTVEQTKELKEKWLQISGLVEERKNNIALLKLSRNTAVLTHKQLYMVCVNIAHFGLTSIPDWCHEMLDSQKECV